MSRIALTTTADETLLSLARRATGHPPDDVLIDAALKALVATSDPIDAAYIAYEDLRLATPDAWGDLESFLAVWSQLAR